MGEAGYDKRARWLLGHRVAGVSTAALAFADLILGLVLADRGAGFIAGAAIVWGALVAGFAAKRVGDARKRLRRGSMLEEANGAASAGGRARTCVSCGGVTCLPRGAIDRAPAQRDHTTAARGQRESEPDWHGMPLVRLATVASRAAAAAATAARVAPALVLDPLDGLLDEVLHHEFASVQRALLQALALLD